MLLNGSFEDINSCPDDFDQLIKAEPWKSVGGTVDLFDSCSISVVPDPPQGPLEYADFKFGSSYSRLGFSFPFRLRSDTIFREFMQGQLANTLSSGSYYVSLYAYTTQVNRTNHLDIYFAESDVGFIGSFPKNINPQFSIEEWIGEYRAWKLHEGCLSGLEGSNYVVIGNFQPPGQDAVEFSDMEFSNVIFLDNVSIVAIPELLDETVAIFPGECLDLDTAFNSLPVEYYAEGVKLENFKICPKRDMVIEQVVRGCSILTKRITIHVLDCSCSVFVPNIVNAQSENATNQSIIVGYDLECVSAIDKFSLFNRWGNLIVDTKELPIDISSLIPGVYVYSVTFDCHGTKYSQHADITIIK